LFICHNKEVLEQANIREYQKHLGKYNLTYAKYYGKQKKTAQVTFSTPQTLNRNLDEFDAKAFDYIIVDEDHHYQARTYKEVLEYFYPKLC